MENPKNARTLSMSVLRFISTSVRPDGPLGGCISEDPRKCSDECEGVWMSGSGEKAASSHTRGQAMGSKQAPFERILL